MPKFAICILIIVGCCRTVSADTFWVLGSYSKKENALAEQVRLANLLSTEILIIPFHAAGTFRVVARREALTEEQLMAEGVQGWKAYIDVEQDTGPPQVASVEAKALQPSVDAPTLPGFIEGEGFVRYCSRLLLEEKAPDFCESPAMLAATKLAKRIEERSGSLKDYCRRASTDAEREICDAWRSGEDLDILAKQYR